MKMPARVDPAQSQHGAAVMFSKTVGTRLGSRFFQHATHRRWFQTLTGIGSLPR
jgi:hypothetical protein